MLKADIKALLEEKGIPFRWVDHEPVYTMEDMARLGLDDESNAAKNLFLRDAKGKRHFLVVIRSDKQADLKAFSARFETSRLSFGSEERLEKHLHLKKGAVTPLGILNNEEKDVEVIFDEDLCGLDTIGVHPNENTASVYLSPKDVIELIKEHGNPIQIVKL